MILLILIVLELNILQNKLNVLFVIKNKQTNIFRIQAYDSIMCECFRFGFIDFILNDKSLTDFTNLFYQIAKEKDDIISNDFKDE